MGTDFRLTVSDTSTEHELTFRRSARADLEIAGGRLVTFGRCCRFQVSAQIIAQTQILMPEAG
jgi:hypothetical protein